MTVALDPDTFCIAGDLQGEEAQVASFQRLALSSYAGRWTVVCAAGALVAEVAYRLIA